MDISVHASCEVAKGVLRLNKDDLTATVNGCTVMPVDEVVPGPMAAMKWIETEVGNS